MTFEQEFARWIRFFNDSKNSNGYSIPSPAYKYMLKVATRILEKTEGNSNENIFKKQPPDVFHKKSVLKYLLRFIGKQPEACNFIKKRLWQRCFSVNFAKFTIYNLQFRTTPPGDCF